MKALPSLVAYAVFAVTPCAAPADRAPAPTPAPAPTATATTLPLSVVGAGAHGYDFLIGRWNCTNSAPYSIYDALRFSVTYSSAGSEAGTLLGISRSRGYGEMDILVAYVSDANAWVMSYGSTDGFHGKETTQDVGQKIVWVGSEGDAESRPMNSRDTWTFQSLTEYDDLAEDQIHGKWIVTGNDTCRKA